MTSLYAALDEPNADVDLILGLIADWYCERCDERREAACRWMVAMGKRPDRVMGWYMLGSLPRSLPLAHAGRRNNRDYWLQWYHENQLISDYYSHAVDALADQWPAEVADWWHALRTRGEEPVPGMDERMVGT